MIDVDLRLFLYWCWLWEARLVPISVSEFELAAWEPRRLCCPIVIVRLWAFSRSNGCELMLCAKIVLFKFGSSGSSCLNCCWSSAVPVSCIGKLGKIFEWSKTWDLRCGCWAGLEIAAVWLNRSYSFRSYCETGWPNCSGKLVLFFGSTAFTLDMEWCWWVLTS